MLNLRSVSWIGVCLFSSFTFAARLKSYCVMPENGREVKGQNVEERMPIASVSKVFTSLLAVTQNSVNRKISTQFYYTPIKGDVYDVHIKGSHEPYFNRQMLHWMIARLNEAGVYKIRELSFDENFKYFHDTNKKNHVGRHWIDPVSGKAEIDAPAPDDVRLQLMQNAEVMKQYAQSVKEAQENGVQLPAKIVFNPQKVTFVSSNQFKESAGTKKAYVSSPDLLHMLKLMNWNSNNHAANQIFQFSGGTEQFKKLFYEKYAMTEKDVVFVNGSGQNANIAGTGREYNEATCSTVVRTVRALKKALESQNVKLQDALSVVGGDIGSTVGGKTYNNPTTNLSVIAKTGTVGTNITLAGMISAKSGNHFFFFNVEVNPAPSRVRRKAAWVNAEAARARNIISYQLNKMILSLGGPEKFDYKIKSYDLENFEESATADLAETAQ